MVSFCIGPATRLEGYRLDEQDGWSFWRFNLDVQLISAEQAVTYSVVIPGEREIATK